MKVIKRQEVNSPYGKCTECNVGTRSHVLEYPDYEEFEEEIPEEMQEFQGRKKQENEEPEVLIRYRRLNDPTVVCHKCWLKQKAKAIAYLNKHSEMWTSDLTIHMLSIRRFLKDWQYFDFSSLRANIPQPVTQDDLAVINLRKQVKAFLTGSEEE